jgi:uncharacterized protein (TIGR02246 family)
MPPDDGSDKTSLVAGPAHAPVGLAEVARPGAHDKRSGVEAWELIARERIRDLVAAYAHCADSGRFDELVALFADDGVLETPDGQAHGGRDAIRAFLTGTKTHLAATAARAPLIRHHVSNLRIVVSGPTAATGAAYFFVITERGPDHWGRYRDRYVCVAGQWRFAHRRVRLDGRERHGER